MTINKMFFTLFISLFFVVGGLFVHSQSTTQEYSVQVYLDKDADPFKILPEVGSIKAIHKIENAPNAYDLIIKSNENPLNIIKRIKQHKKVNEIFCKPAKFE